MILVQSQGGVTIENGWNHQKSVLAHSMDTKPPREKTTSYLLCVWQVQCWGPPNRFSSNSCLFAAKNLMENPANTACFGGGMLWNPDPNHPGCIITFPHENCQLNGWANPRIPGLEGQTLCGGGLLLLGLERRKMAKNNRVKNYNRSTITSSDGCSSSSSSSSSASSQSSSSSSSSSPSQQQPKTQSKQLSLGLNSLPELLRALFWASVRLSGVVPEAEVENPGAFLLMMFICYFYGVMIPFLWINYGFLWGDKHWHPATPPPGVGERHTRSCPAICSRSRRHLKCKCDFLFPSIPHLNYVKPMCTIS